MARSDGRDAFGRVLEVGMRVAIVSGSRGGGTYKSLGYVNGFTPQRVRCGRLDQPDTGNTVHSSSVIILSEEGV